MMLNKPLKVLFIHEVSYQSKFVFEMHEFPELIALQGNEVGFIEFPEDESSWKSLAKSKVVRISGRALPRAEISLFTPFVWGTGMFARLTAVVSTPILLNRVMRQTAPDVIVCFSVPTSGWQACQIARKKGVPFVFRSLDVSHLLRPSLFKPLVKLAEKYIYKRSTVLSANNPALLQYCEQISGRTGKSTVNLPPLDFSHFSGTLKKGALAKYGVPSDGDVLMYMGTFFRFSGLERVIYDFDTAAENNPNLWLVMVGGGEIEKSLHKKAAETQHSNRIVFTGKIDYLELGEILRSADVALNPFESEFLTNVALPHKVLQYMSSGVPVVSTKLRGLLETVGSDSGVTDRKSVV